MKKLFNNIPLLNTISNLILQVVTMISAFILPKIVLNYFGSEVNGLVNSLNQLLNYISLLEGGVTGVIMASLYKPLYDKDYNKLSSVIATTQKFYRKIGIFSIAYSLLLAIIYPLILNTNFSYMYVFSLTLILSINLFMQYIFSLTLRTLLNADKKVYIVSLSQSLLLVLNIILSIVSVTIFPNIHFLKIVTSIIYILQPFIYRHFVNKYYTINKQADYDNDLLKNRWSGFAINVAAFIHFNTDTLILTVFTDLSTVSVYSVYKLVTNGINQLISSVASALSPSIGYLYASRKQRRIK